jgi:uncharacterized membrane protein (DUF4010 family)
MVEPAQSLLSLGYAGAIGLLVGLERGWTGRDADDGHRVAGIRTFGLLGLAGGTAALVAGPIGAILVLLSGIVLIVGYIRQTRAHDGQSATNAIAGLLVLGLSSLAASGQPETALAGAAVSIFLLSSRQRLHRLVSDLTADEMRAAAEFAIVALVLFPLAPDRGMGPFGAINPHHILFVVVLVSGISFAAYLAGHHLSRGKGPMLTAAAGALVSSTAVTAALARRMRDSDDAEAWTLTAGLLIASIVGGLRILAVIAFLAPLAFANAAGAILPGLAVLAATTVWAWDGKAVSATDWKPVGNPLELGAAVAFAAIAMVATLGSRLASSAFGSSGPLVVLTATGMADVDAAVLAFSSLPPTDQAMLAGPALAVPVAANMLLKAIITMLLTRNRAGVRAALPLVSCAALIVFAATVIWFRV